MSRQRSYAYQVGNPTNVQLDLWETVVVDHAAMGLYPEAVCSGGGGSPEQFDIWLYCNRTKADVYRQRLDQVFGTSGRIVDLDEELQADAATG